MPASSIAQQKLFGMALSCKKGELKECSSEVQKLADSMSEAELEKFASVSHETIPEKVQEELAEIYAEFAALNEAKVSNEIQQPAGKPLAQAKTQPTGNKVAKTDGKIPASADNKTDTKDVLQEIPPGMKKATDKVAITPSLFKLPGGKAKHERRIYDFGQFMKIINYKTHDGDTQFGKGKNNEAGTGAA